MFFFELAIGSIMAWLCRPVTAGLVTETLYVGYVWHWIPPTFRTHEVGDVSVAGYNHTIVQTAPWFSFCFVFSFSLVACLLISFQIWNLSLRNSEYL
jgi:hypothetical protein